MGGLIGILRNLPGIFPFGKARRFIKKKHWRNYGQKKQRLKTDVNHRTQRTLSHFDQWWRYRRAHLSGDRYCEWPWVKNIQGSELAVVGGLGKMEMQKSAWGWLIRLSDCSAEFTELIIRLIKVSDETLESLRQAQQICKWFQARCQVVGVGGYARCIRVIYARKRKGPSNFGSRANSYAGLNIRFFPRELIKICVAFIGMDKFLPIGTE